MTSKKSVPAGLPRDAQIYADGSESMSDLVQEILARIDDAREELAEWILRLGNTYAPVGQEATVAEVIDDWCRRHDLPSRLMPIVEGRANVVAALPGRGGGRSLLFNAHLDTEVSGADYDHLMQTPDINRMGAWREGDRLFGHPILNDRGCLALALLALRVLREVDAPLAGDVIVTGVAGETGQAPVDEFTGMAYEGKGLGSQFLVDHGVRADYALVAETTDHAVCWYNCGAAYYKVTLRGRNMYTPRLLRPDRLADHPNAIVKAAAVVQAIEAWARRYQAERSGPTPCGEVQPKAQVGAIRGGLPYRPNRSAPYAALYVDVRIRPEDRWEEVTASFKAAVEAVGVGAEVEPVMFKPGAIGQGVEPLVQAIAHAHRRVRGAPLPDRAESAVVSMWRDTNIFNRAGIPAVTFGPSRGQAAYHGSGHFELDDLVAGAKMYALTALQLAAGVALQDPEA